jgi:hypothetical protein
VFLITKKLDASFFFFTDNIPQYKLSQVGAWLHKNVVQDGRLVVLL